VNVLEQATQAYETTGGAFDRDVAAYACHGGYVFLAPDHILLSKPVRRDGGDPSGQWNVEGADAWFVKFAAGDGRVRKFIELMPFPLPWVGWARETKKRPVNWFSLAAILRRIST